MENGGWVKLHRSLLDSKFGRNLEILGIWAHLLLSAQWKDGFTPDGTPLKAGQLMTSYLSISAKFSITESKVRRILLKLKTAGQIDVQSSTKNTIISITNWSKYQSDEGQSEEQMKNERRTSEERAKIYKKDNNIKNDKKDKNILSNDNIILSHFDKFWESYPKRVGDSKAKARQSFLKASKKHDTDTIVKQAQIYAKTRLGEDRQFTPMASTWLNQERFLDDFSESVSQDIITQCDIGFAELFKGVL